MGHTNVTATDTYVNATTQPLHELNERKQLTLVKIHLRAVEGKAPGRTR